MNPLNFYRGKSKFPYEKLMETRKYLLKLNYGLNLVHDNARVGFVMDFVIVLL